MLSYLRSVGIDDGFFPPQYKELKLRTFLVGTLYHGRTPKDIKVESVTVDGDDGTEKSIEILKRFAGADIVFLDGVTVAGFNFVDPEMLLELAKAVIVIYKFEPDLNKIENALRNHFPDWERRYGVILKAYKRSRLLETKWRAMRIAAFGDANLDPQAVVSYLQLVSPIPEPLRTSDIVASSLSRNETLLNKLKEKLSDMRV
jgi:endonuclease V-like protein UPF0215 family